MQATLKRIATILLTAALAMGLTGCADGTIRLPDTDLAGPRLLVIAPHPDDETVGAGGAIATARRRGWTVTIVYVTSGDGFWQAVRKQGGPFPRPDQMRAYGERRVAEARRAATDLGVPASNVIFLGFPDGSESDLWNTNWDSSNPRRATNGSSSVPYAFALKSGAPYSGEAVESELEQVIRRVRPTTVLLPDPADVNRDHWAVAAFAQAALARTGFAGLSLTYLVHRSDFPATSGLQPTAALSPPTALSAGPTRWYSLPLDRREVATQQVALSEHKTQLHADGRLVQSFVRANALLGLDSPTSLGKGSVAFPESHDRVYKTATPSTSISRMLVHRDKTGAVTITAALHGAVDPSATYVFRARALDSRGAWHFWSASVIGGKLQAVRDSKLAVTARGQLVSDAGEAITVRVPAQVFVGAKWLFAGADVLNGARYDDHAPLQLIRLVASAPAGSAR